ncbi:MAG: hypothetical protein K8I27_11555 [Planctomycetes bacterium]|nr:hypothetical protein [Planctomycetota bacterium]
MSDVITFDCTSCGMPYRVAASYAGRDFSCKKCGAHLCVPQSGQEAGFRVEPEVELSSGTEVMRRMTPSGRQAPVNPTRVFTRERETSQRMASVGAPGRAEKSGKGVLIGGVIGGIVLLGAAIAIAVVLTGDKTPDATDATTVTVDSPTPAEPSERDTLLARLDEGLDARELVALLKEADGKVEDADLAAISRRMVNAISAEKGAELEDAELLALAERVKASADSERLYMMVIARHRGVEPVPASCLQAREKLGYSRLELTAQAERARGLAAAGVVEGIGTLDDELQALLKRADDGWSPMSDKAKFDAIVEQLDAAQTRIDQLRREDPFRFKLATARLEFSRDEASSIGTWVSVARDPYVIFVQLQAREDQPGAERRLRDALLVAEQFPAFFNAELREDLELKRMLPSALPGDEREDAPIVIKLFRSASYWHAYLRDHGYGDVDAERARTFTEPATGHVSMVYDHDSAGGTSNLGKFIRALVDVSMYSYHPHAPTTHEEDENFRAYNAFFLDAWFHTAISITNRASDTYTFMSNDPRAARRLSVWKKPFAKDARDRFDSFGGQLLSVKDFVTCQDVDAIRAAIVRKLESIEAWTEQDLMVARQSANLDTIWRGYAVGLFAFLFHWGPDGEPRYREKFLKFVRMDLSGEVDKENPVPAFEKAFGLDAAGWKQLEADFTAYQAD